MRPVPQDTDRPAPGAGLGGCRRKLAHRARGLSPAPRAHVALLNSRPNPDGERAAWDGSLSWSPGFSPPRPCGDGGWPCVGQGLGGTQVRLTQGPRGSVRNRLRAPITEVRSQPAFAGSGTRPRAPCRGGVLDARMSLRRGLAVQQRRHGMPGRPAPLRDQVRKRARCVGGGTRRFRR